MKLKLFALFGILLLALSLMPVQNAAASTPIFKGMYVNTSHEGLRAIMSTGQGTGSPPAFSFTAFSPDTKDQAWQLHLEPKASCVRVGVDIPRSAGNITTRNFFVDNLCTGGRLTTTSLSNATFRSKYVNVYSFNDTGTAYTDEGIDVRVYKTTAVPAIWQVWLYNFSTSSYDFVISVTGAGSSTNGSIEYVDYGETQQATGAYCPTLYPYGVLEMRGLQRYSFATSTWTTLSSGDISYFNDPMLCITNSTYKVTTPQPYQWKLLPFGASY